MKLAIIGTGYVGLVTGTCFADMGHDVICVDSDSEKIEMLTNGQIPIWEPGLEELVSRNITGGRLLFTEDTQYAIEISTYIFIAVGTPPDEDGSADLQYVLSVAKEIGTHMNGYKVVIDKSTVPVGTAEKVKFEINKILQSRNLDYKFDVVSNPEFLKEGAAIDDFMKPDRIIIGVDNVAVGDMMTSLYSSFSMTSKAKVILMSVRSAEMTKYAANAMLATKISFINEISLLCEKLGADVSEVRHGIGSDSRIGYKFIFPGIGYGGSCFPKDVQALVQMAHEVQVEPLVIQAVEERNNLQKKILFEKIYKHYNGDLLGKHFAVWGLSFKPQTDDMREAPSIIIINLLLKSGATISVYDPVAINEARRVFAEARNVQYLENQYDALIGVDGLLLVTEWHQFRNPDFSRMKHLMKTPAIFDGRNQYEPTLMKDLGFIYYGIGRLVR